MPKKKLKITIIQKQFKLKHLSVLSKAGEEDNKIPIHEIIETLQEITEEDIEEYPVDSIPKIVEVLGEQLEELSAGDEDESGN